VPFGPVHGAGLASMRARAEELGGACTVRFRRNEGTEVVAMLPVTAR
jgi:signal transduction histidine kinase